MEGGTRMSIRILHPGLLTTIQDTGRFGFQLHGVIVSGAMDSFALRAANLLVGNDQGAAALEMTLMGPRISFEKAALIAICGANLSPTIQGRPLPLWRSVYVESGSILEFGACQAGARAYLSAAGGIDVPIVMQSRSTYLRAGLGGLEGRALKTGDVLPLESPSGPAIRYIERETSLSDSRPFHAANWYIGHEALPAYTKNPTVRAVRGRDYACFTEESKQHFFTGSFLVSTQSDRMGYRLEGAALSLKEAMEPISEAVSFGTVQIPGSGNPIVLMADYQTIGGYPKIAQIAASDLPLLAQVKPGDTIAFQEVSRQEAEALYIKMKLQMIMLAKAIEVHLQVR
jgi:antagonist of KipI